MIKDFFVWIMACLPATAVAQSNQFTIEGSLDAYNVPAKIYLRYRPKDKDVNDSTMLVNGKFKFAGQVDGDPVEAFLAFNAKGTGFNYQDIKQVFLEKGIITLKGTNKLKKAAAGGTPVNVDNKKLNTDLAAVNASWEGLSATEKATSDQEKQSPESLTNTYKLLKDIQHQQDIVYKKFITENPDSYISLFTLDRYACTTDYKEIAPLFESLSAGIKQTVLGQHLAGRSPHIKMIALGAIAPDFAEADTSGKMVSLSLFRGKYVLIDFWASWCNPCRAENPNIIKAFNLYKSKNFTVIGVSLDGPGEKNNWLAAIRKDSLPWTHVSDLNSWYGKAAVLYLVGDSGIPQNFLLDPNGKIIAKHLRGGDLHDELEQIFGKR